MPLTLFFRQKRLYFDKISVHSEKIGNYFEFKGLQIFNFFLFISKGGLKMTNFRLIKLISEFKSGNMNSFPKIYDAFKKLILFYSAKTEDEDALCELNLFFVELLYSLDLNKFPCDFSDGLSRYIAVALKNKYLKISKLNQKYKSASVKLLDQIAYNDEDYTGELLEAVKLLSPKQRAIIILKFIYGYSDFEISVNLNISRQAVNRLKNRALSVLKLELSKDMLL